jgi:tape measure domain-containing protein
MATSNNRDVKMTLSVDTLGAEDVKKLQSTIAALAKQGGEAAPEFQRLADEIGRLGDQSDALRSFQALADQTEELTARQRQAVVSVEELAAKYQEAAAGTRAAAEAQRAAADQLAAARVAQRATRDELATLIATTDKAKLGEQAYADEVQRLRLAKIEQRAEVERLTAALKTSNEAVTAAERAEAKLEGSFNRATQAATAAEAAVTKQQAALHESALAAAELGVSTENLAQSQASMARGFTQLQQRADTLTDRLAALAERERELAGIRAFQQQADDAKRLFDTATYADLFEQALAGVAAAEREVASAQAAVNWQREAEAIVNAAEATQRLARQQEIMLQVQRELANDRAMAKQAEDAEKLARQTDQIRLFTQVLDQLEEQERQTAAAAEQAAAQIKNAFGTVGVRSVQEMESEVTQVRTAMETLRTTAGVTGGALTQAFTAGNAKINQLERDIRAARGEMTLADRAAGLFKNSLGQIAAGNIIADGVGYLVNKIKELASAFVDVVMQTERMRKGLQAVYKDTAVAAQQFSFFRQVANDAGVSIGSINDAFLRFSAATKSANIPLHTTNELFRSVVQAGATLGLTGEQVAGTLDALGQMASKGTVSMEELRQQLGDRLPGALSLAAKGLGITEANLIKLVESGKLTTEEFFPAFAVGLKAMAGDTDTLTGAWQRFTNALNQGAVAVGDAGGLTLLKLAVQGLAVAFGVVAVPLQFFIEAINLAVRAVGVFFTTISGNATDATFQEFGKQLDKSGERIKQFQGSIDAAINSGDKQTASLKEGVTAQAGMTAALLRTATAQERLAAGDAAAAASSVQALVRLTRAATAADAAATASEKLQKAKEDEGKALVATAQLSGDAAVALDAAARATTANVAASQAVAIARRQELLVNNEYIAGLEREKAGAAGLSASKQQLLDKALQLQSVQEAEVERARQSTAELERQALAAQTAAAAYRDNSDSVGAYQVAMQSAQTEAAMLRREIELQVEQLALLKIGLDDGRVSQARYDEAKTILTRTTDRLNDATGRSAKYEALYRDAVADSIAAVDRKARADAASLTVSEALAKTQQAHYETMARQAKALGDEAQATYYTIEAKLKQIEAIKLATQIKNLELAADKAGIEIQIAALKPSDELYQQKKQELEIRLQLIKAKQIEANASGEVIKGIEDEIVALRRLNGQRGGSVNIVNSRGQPDEPRHLGTENSGQPSEPQRPGNEKQEIFFGGPAVPSADKKATPSQGSGGQTPAPARAPAPAPASPFSFSAGGDLQTRTGIANFLRNAGVTDPEDIKRITRQFTDGQGNVPYINNPGQKKYADGGTISMALLKAAETVTFGNKSRGAAAAPAPSAPAPAAAGGSSHSVTIDLGNGRRDTFNMATERDAAGLTGLLSQLGNAKGVS